MFRNLFPILNTILVTVLIFFTVKLGYQILSAKLLQVASPDIEMLADPGTYAKRSSSTADHQKFKNISAYQPIMNRDLFKTKEDAKPDKDVSDLELEKLKQTSLNLKLFGTITGRDEQDYAVIEEYAKTQTGIV